jgi:DNA helicase-2/ATP-dependent DNA helicase PcrA
MPRDYELKPFRPPVNFQIDYAAELNPQQHAAVTAAPGPSLVIAGAGSGKTRTLTYRVAFLLEQGIEPDRVLLLTFTNKAAKEMMRRVSELLGNEQADLWGGTFHSIGNRILRRHAPLLGYRSDFTILDREDAEDLLQAALDEMNLDPTQTLLPKIGVVADVFSLAVNKDVTVGFIVSERYRHFLALVPKLEELQKRYVARKLASNSMDFDDLLALWLKLLREHADIREEYQRRFAFILVDEYQDTNKIQGEVIDLLAARHKNLMVVGDDSQSIYSWRGANFLNIMEFPNRYAGAKVYRIETNYRSTPEILQLANAAIKANARQFEKELNSSRKPGCKPVVVQCDDGARQAQFIAQRALELRDEGVALRNMAVLYRSHFHALELQMELTRRNIPFSITSGIRFFEQAHVKDVAAWLKLVANPTDELSFKRVARLLPGIGAKTADKLWAIFQEKRAVISAEAPAPAPLARTLQLCAPSVPKKATVSWAQNLATFAQIEASDVRNKPSRMIQIVVEAVYEDYLKSKYPNYRARTEDLEQAAAFAVQFTSLDDFLAQMALQSNIEAEAESKSDEDGDDRIRLSTIHQAKGLEFDVVFVLMLCEGLFPSARSMDSSDSLEEERRLFYVAVTRARNELYLTHPAARVTPAGGMELTQPSRFLEELPPELYEEWNLKTTNY